MPSWRLRLTAELRRDKKKTTMLVALVVAAGVLSGKMLVKQIASAGAAQGPTGTALVVSETSRGGALKTETSRSVGGKSLGKAVIRAFNKDIFRVQWGEFPAKSAVSGSATTARTLKTRTMTEDQTKRRVIDSLAQSLALQSIIGGARPAVIINGRIVRVGRTVNGFVVVSVGAHSCVVKKDGVFVTIQLQGWSAPEDSRVNGAGDSTSRVKPGKER